MPQFLPHDAATTGDPNFSNNETFSVDLSTPAVDGDSIAFEAASSTWKPSSGGGGGGGNPIGSIIQSILSQAEINTQEADTWQLCDGSMIIAGSALATLNPTVLGGNVPNAQGRFLAGAGAGDTGAAAKALGMPLGSQNLAHTHSYPGQGPFIGAGQPATTNNANGSVGAFASSSEGGDEARPFTYVVNHFIKIN